MFETFLFNDALAEIAHPLTIFSVIAVVMWERDFLFVCLNWEVFTAWFFLQEPCASCTVTQLRRVSLEHFCCWKFIMSGASTLEMRENEVIHTTLLLNFDSACLSVLTSFLTGCNGQAISIRVFVLWWIRGHCVLLSSKKIINKSGNQKMSKPWVIITSDTGYFSQVNCTHHQCDQTATVLSVGRWETDRQICLQ